MVSVMKGSKPLLLNAGNGVLFLSSQILFYVFESSNCSIGYELIFGFLEI